jgi:hypothetical protein
MTSTRKITPKAQVLTFSEIACLLTNASKIQNHLNIGYLHLIYMVAAKEKKSSERYIRI